MENGALDRGSSVAAPTDQAEGRLCGVGLTFIQKTIKCYMKHDKTNEGLQVSIWVPQKKICPIKVHGFISVSNKKCKKDTVPKDQLALEKAMKHAVGEDRNTLGWRPPILQEWAV